MDGPLDHVAREGVPWKAVTLTECGRSISTVESVVSRVEMDAKVEREGKTRASFTSCMTCWLTAHRHPLWVDHPVAVLSRAYATNEAVGYGRKPDRADSDELRAIALLIEAHREEFDLLVASLNATVDLGERRRPQRRRGLS